MAGETNLVALVRGMKATLHEGAYVFCSLTDASSIRRADTICEIKEPEGTSLVLERSKADELKLSYDFVASWITLMVHSSLEAVGLTALFSTELARNNISCNVIAGYYHDHIFVDKKDTDKAMRVLTSLSDNYNKPKK